jgi:formylglycine-generating enzyme required for sulfatase activity
LDSSPPTSGQSAACAWNASFLPLGSCMSHVNVCQGSQCGNHPQTCVDWCDAYAYCRAVGKRLCGRIGGGANPIADHATVSKSQWYNACSSGGLYNFPYGDGYEGTTCNGGDNPSQNTVPVGSLVSCEPVASSYAGIFDLSGNANEWEDSCENSAQSGNCLIRGGDRGTSDISGQNCAYEHLWIRDYPNFYIGFRCCSDP